MQQLSYRSDDMASETSRSAGDGGADLERKVRGGMCRSLSTQTVPSPLHANSLPAHTSHTSLTAWERLSARRSGSSGGCGGGAPAMGDRLASSSSMGSPGAESSLLGCAHGQLSPHQSPVVAPLGGGYSRVVVSPGAPPHMGTRVQSLAPLGFADLQRRPAPVLEKDMRADVVAHNTHLSRTTTDTAGIVEAVATLSRAAAAVAHQP